jgi:transposase
MYAHAIKNKTTGRTGVLIYEAFRGEDKKPHTRMVRNLGFVDQLEKEHPDVMAWAKGVAAAMNEEKATRKAEYLLAVDPSQVMEKEDISLNPEKNRKNIGYAAFSYIYHELELDEFMDNRRRYSKAKANLNSIFKLLVFNRLLFPDTKLGAWENRGLFFEDTDFPLESVYRSLDFFLKHREALLLQMHKAVCSGYGRDTFLLFYDVTNYYFEIDDNDGDATGENGETTEGLRKRGVSKEHRPNPIVQMGLFMDENGIPVTYDLFPGNKNDCLTFQEMGSRTVEQLKLNHHLINVADKGMMTGDNIASILLNHNGYIISNSVRKVDGKFKEYVLDQTGYEMECDGNGEMVSKHKGRYTPREIWTTNKETGKRKKTIINERQVVFYSQKYADRARYDRLMAIEKASKKDGILSSFGMDSHYGSSKYLTKTPLDKETGEIKQDSGYILSFNQDKVDEDERLDGYYIICTNVIGLEEGEKPFDRKCRFRKDGYLELNREVPDSQIIEMYRGLWRIEETFKVTKSDLEARPVFVWSREHIQAHFLICFTALTIMRLLEKRLDWKYSAARLQESLSLACGSYVSKNLYVFDHYDEVLEVVGKNLGIDFSRKYCTRSEIRTLLGKTKK